MIHITIVEDSKEDADALEMQLAAYARETGTETAIAKFADPLAYLQNIPPQTEAIFLDIDMPAMSGMQLAHKIRETDKNVIIVFVTNMLQYALDGYAVSALDFLIKPINYQSVLRTMNKVTETLSSREEKSISIKNSVDGRVIMVSASDIFYVEINRHRVIYHTKLGELVDWGSLDVIQSKLPAKIFARCHVSFLVNLKYVSQIEKDTVVVGKDRLPMSRSQKKNFCADLARYLGKGW